MERKLERIWEGKEKHKIFSANPGLQPSKGLASEFRIESGWLTDHAKHGFLCLLLWDGLGLISRC